MVLTAWYGGDRSNHTTVNLRLEGIHQCLRGRLHLGQPHLCEHPVHGLLQEHFPDGYRLQLRNLHTDARKSALRKKLSPAIRTCQNNGRIDSTSWMSNKRARERKCLQLIGRFMNVPNGSEVQVKAQTIVECQALEDLLLVCRELFEPQQVPNQMQQQPPRQQQQQELVVPRLRLSPVLCDLSPLLRCSGDADSLVKCNVGEGSRVRCSEVDERRGRSVMMEMQNEVGPLHGAVGGVESRLALVLFPMDKHQSVGLSWLRFHSCRDDWFLLLRAIGSAQLAEAPADDNATAPSRNEPRCGDYQGSS
eukprot:SAG11_NODE_3569_length_2363_cov_2.581272_2_plen_306_part_00